MGSDEKRWKIETDKDYTDGLAIVGELIPCRGGAASELNHVVLITTDCGCDFDDQTVAVAVTAWDAQEIVDAHNEKIGSKEE